MDGEEWLCAAAKPENSRTEIGMPEDDPRIIEQRMWPYQYYFRISALADIKRTLKEVNFFGDTDVLLAGFEAEGMHEFPICVESEDGTYDPSILSGVRSRAEELYEQHSERNTFYSDPYSEHAARERLRRQMGAKAVEEALASSNPGAGLSFFVGMPIRVDDYDVHVVVSVDRASLEAVPQLQTTKWNNFDVHPSLVHAVIHNVLARASRSLYTPQAGSELEVLAAQPAEIVQSAAASFVGAVFARAGNLDAQKSGADVSAISALPYEGRSGAGRLIIAEANHSAISVLVKFDYEVEIADTQAARKLLEASGSEGDLLSTGNKIFGLGRLTDTYDAATETVFIVSVTTRGTWEISHAGQVLMTVRDGIPHLPRPPLDTVYFDDIVARLLPDADRPRLLTLAEAAGQHEHGTMLVISSNAAGEAQRLAPQAWTIKPVNLAPELLRQLTSMDGGVLVDSQGSCHAVGVILDGKACGGENPARGSRFNNAVRYLKSPAPPAVVVVYSADGGIDILPRLQPRVKRSTVEQAVERYLNLAASGKHPSGRPNYWRHVEQLEFYLSSEQCQRLNEAQAALRQSDEDRGYITVVEPPLTPNPDMNENYWLPEEDEGASE
jgi:hypothetical protein